MKRKIIFNCSILTICILLFLGCANGQDANPCNTGGQTCYFGVKMNGILCGYSVETECTGILDGKSVRYETSDIIFKMTLLGEGMDFIIKTLMATDPVTERPLLIDFKNITGETSFHTTTRVSNDTAYFTNNSSGEVKTVLLGEDVIISSQTTMPHLLNDFVKQGIDKKGYLAYEPFRGELVEKVYKKKREEKLNLNDSLFYTIVIEETDLSSGRNTTLWLNKENGFIVKAFEAGRDVFLTDKSVIGRIQMVDMDNVLFAKVNTIINDFTDLTWMKVKAQIDSYGDKITPESLNFNGQKFTGSVTGSLIDGIFEIEQIKYDGTNAPPFPPNFGNTIDMKKYLEPETYIESGDQMIISLAEKITAGSNDSWEAAVSLCSWVGENIAGAIPGGGSAINTLKIREGECGGHSRLLTAFCRAVGIPARLSIGCMYSTYYTGSFGQHAWTEVYMGKAGWIAVDATIFETDYVDAGHIRLGEETSFQPRAMEIIDYKVGSGGADASPEEIPGRYRSLVGNYTKVDRMAVFNIMYRESGLYVNIPGSGTLPLNEPDEKGIWYPKMTRQVGFAFPHNSIGKPEKMILRQVAPVSKKSTPESISSDVPSEFQKFLGNYTFQPGRISLDVSYSNGSLSMQEPLGRSKENITFSDNGEFWTDENGDYEIRFETDQNDKVIRLNLTVIINLLRGEPVTNAIEPVIEESGIAAGIAIYRELRKEASGDYIFLEQVLNSFGYRLLNEDKTEHALEVFKLNASEYPESFNVYNGLGEAYMKKGDNRLALENFNKSVEMNPNNEFGKKKIQEINNKE